ncbi:Single-stranded nucleic acid binding R3H domain-containing protein [Hyella patelloides LEGE 07179]|uniref:Single-stranded nucleic acid binding R3H domain-containing protein n=1 Tax=Hyella patelloides LEGE 07179 TaxID=945734 RepID=A0A563VXJ4_9CYAN|nr:R3H domain-containing nucleic acid-binding protein [Hyella patelloides]VEP16140.1 Single-stranded nucleic acid binding R3H domain-containing protein [Hyella patelloides LEGE 07179]
MTQEKIASHRMQITDNLEKLLAILPETILTQVNSHSQKDNLIEIVMDLGRLPEARFHNEVTYLGESTITKEDIQHCVERVGMFGADNRAGIERTLHRISAIRNRAGEIIGLTCRIGRAVFGTIVMIRDLVETGQSILLLGRPGVGKTTALREIARVLADDLNKRVVIIDTSNEIAGDGDIPHPAIGRARRMQVARPELQHQVMIEAVENHMPEVIVIDEISTELEALAARTIAERGVQLVGTAHGNSLANLVKNPTLSDLVGGVQAVTLGDDEARRRRSQKTVLERKAPPTFAIAVEMLERQRWVVHEDTAETIDTLLRGIEPATQIRTVNDNGEVSVIHEEAQLDANTLVNRSMTPSLGPGGWRASGKMNPVASFGSKRKKKQNPQFEQMLESSWQTQEPHSNKLRTPGPNGEDWPVYIYPYGIGRSQLEQVIGVLDLPIMLTKDLDGADAVIALRSQIKHHSRLRQLAKNHHLPIHAVKSNTIPQITRVLRQLLNLDDPNVPEATDMRLFTKAGNDDEIEALEEARLAVEQIVIPQGQPVELLPRSAKVRKMQHELVEHYRLQSDSFGEEPNRRLRIYPA